MESNIIQRNVIRCRLIDVSDKLSEMDLSVVADDIAETDDNMQLVISGVIVRIPDLQLDLREGVVCMWDDEEEVFMPDFDVTVVYESGNEIFVTQEKERVSNYIYFEQDGMVITLANWLNGRMPVDMIEQLWCEIIVPMNDN